MSRVEKPSVAPSLDSTPAPARKADGWSKMDWRARAREAHIVKMRNPDLLLAWFGWQPPGPVCFRKIVQFGPVAFRGKAIAEVALAKLVRDRKVAEVCARPRQFEMLNRAEIDERADAEKAKRARIEAENNRFAVPLPEVVRWLWDELQRLQRSGEPGDGIGEAIRADARRRLRGDIRMMRRQLDPSRCFVCGSGQNASAELVAVKTADPDHLHQVHAGECFAEHCHVEKSRWAEVVEAAVCSLMEQLRA